MTLRNTRGDEVEDEKAVSQLRGVLRSVGDEVPLLPCVGNALAAPRRHRRFLADGRLLPARDSSVKGDTVSLIHCPDCRRLCFVASASCPNCEVSSRSGALRAAAAAEEKSFRRKCGILFLIPFISTLAVLAVVLIRA